MDETWEPSKNQYSFGKLGALDRKVLSLIPILSEINQVHTISYYFVKKHLNIVPLHMSRTSEFFLVRLFRPCMLCISKWPRTYVCPSWHVKNKRNLVLLYANL